MTDVQTDSKSTGKRSRFRLPLRLLALFCAILIFSSTMLGIASTAKLTLDMTNSLREQMATECLSAGLAYLQASRYEQALEYLEALVNLRPEDPEAQSLRGSVYIATGEYEKAQECLSKAIELYGDTVPTQVLLQMASLSVLQGNLAEATPLLERITQQDPAESNGWLLLGQIYYEDKNYEPALECFDRYLKSDPENATALAVRAACRSATGDETGAMEDLVKAAANAKDNPEIRVALAEVYTSIGDYVNAAEAYKMAIEADPSNMESRQAMGACLLYAGDYEGARQVYQDALDTMDEAARDSETGQLIQFSLAVTLEQQGQVDEAISILEELAKTDFEHSTVQAQLAECYAATDDRADEALPLLDGLIEEDATLTTEEKATLLARAANICLSGGDTQKAIEYADRCLELSEKNTEGRLYRAVANLQGGNAKASLADFNALLEADPNLAQVRYYRALAEIQLTDIAAAKTDLNLCALDADEPQIVEAAKALLASL